MLKKKPIIAFVAALIMVLLAGCGGNTGPSANAGGESASSGAGTAKQEAKPPDLTNESNHFHFFRT
jgi:hypothetical protein